ncbi:MAG: winged helix-turn-helix domain-containing protein [Schwartzia sp.]|nr:winged helix-turn-helix domain-containing protein [Schwartzia sp. (in: firmicutes)]
MQHPGVVFSREVLYEKIWGLDEFGDKATVAVHIYRIRDKIESNSERSRYIEALRGTGYRFCMK